MNIDDINISALAELFKEEAQTIFPNVFLADDGKEFDLI